MAVDKNHPQDVDLDRTDQLPVLEGVEIAEDVADDAVRMEYSPIVTSVKPEFPRASGVDLPSLAESVRSVEERIARQNAEFEALSRSYEKARAGESAAVSRANVLAADLAGVRALLESEQSRLRDMEQALAERNAVVEAARARTEEALREAGSHQSEAETLRGQLTSRDATIVQVTHSLGERDAQLAVLQREHAQMVPVLKERSRVGAQLEADLQAERGRSAGLAEALKTTQQSAASLAARLKAGEEELITMRRDLNLMKTLATSYLDQLRTREWRRGFDQNLYREMDAKIGAVQDDRGALQHERDQLRQHMAELESKVAARDESIAKLQAGVASDKDLRVRYEAELIRVEEARSELVRRFSAMEDQYGAMRVELANREQKIAEIKDAVMERDTALMTREQAVRHAETARAEIMEQIAVLEEERGRLHEELASRDATIEELQAAAASDEEARSQHEVVLQQVERVCADLNVQITALEQEKDRLTHELSAREEAIADAKAAAREQAKRSKEMLAGADKGKTDLSLQIERLKSDLKQRDGEMAALVAQLQEARRPLEPIEAEVKRLNAELTAKAASLDQLNEDNRSLRAALERTRGALEEREFLIRRLERSETNNANVLGRIQTSIERLGASGVIVGSGAGGAAAPVECVAELARIDGEHSTTYTLTRRTRIGRAPGCEMQIESTSVSRHHALVLMSTRDVIIEDLNSTNGVLVNGRKVSRQLLHDGDVLTIGEAQFRLTIKFAARALEHSASLPQ